ncbi:hypothetical protein MM239_17020 [Belliella sp. DSM 111904]|uniref:Immunity protein 43 n=1 Tax=Belliella filtrata TaxID=2923435 RepID=A0ABS9V3Z8_9BACT|nr:hypothetical protein [Belliella filtrata]MCH7411109.1 hypothetical protein [Belliella filtrata]
MIANFWIVKYNFIPSPEVGYFYFTEKRNIPQKEGDFVFVLERLMGEWHFTSLFKIMEIKKNEDKTELESLIIFTKREIFEPKPLENFKFSLANIKNYVNPIIHFRSWKKITADEGKMILFSNINEIRSLIGFTFYNMHQDHRKCFLYFLGIFDFNQSYYVYNTFEVLSKLNEYITHQILNPSYQFLESLKLFKEMFGEENYIKLSFAAKDERSNPSIASDQEKIIKQYLPELEKNFGTNFKFRNEELIFSEEYIKKIKKNPLVLKVN